MVRSWMNWTWCASANFRWSELALLLLLLLLLLLIGGWLFWQFCIDPQVLRCREIGECEEVKRKCQRQLLSRIPSVIVVLCSSPYLAWISSFVSTVDGGDVAMSSESSSGLSNLKKVRPCHSIIGSCGVGGRCQPLLPPQRTVQRSSTRPLEPMTWNCCYTATWNYCWMHGRMPSNTKK